MKFKFTKNLDYQLDAIKAVIDIFDTGKNLAKKEVGSFELKDYSQVISNELEIDEKRLLVNLRAIQNQNNIPNPTNVSYDEPGITFDDPIFSLSEDKLESLDFSIEMETGTGKTYVYLRTILELNQKYGLKKFIILVPSVAIREGVIKTIEQTKEHFNDLYNTAFGSFAYDSEKLNKVRDFIQSNDVQVMIMTIQSFNTDTRVLRQTPDRFHGDRPLDLIAQTRPVVIMDEPQNMDSDLAKEAIADLNPLFKLRYSATHKEVHNLVYRLTPVDAYRKGLVKKISVYGVKESNAGAFTFRVNSIDVKRGENPKAKVTIEVKTADGGYTYKAETLQAGSDLYKISKKNDKYQGLLVQDINANHNRVELSDGTYHAISDTNENIETIFRVQIRETIKAHFDKQQQVGDRLKVLSLFFIDKVDNYVPEDSLLRKIFTEEFLKLQKNYPKFSSVDPNLAHAGYFASKKTKGVVEYKDSTGKSKEDIETYNLIMKNKEKLLSFSEPVSFIFSHSALKEGWDNPNIFQICTLRDTQSVSRKRQEIGRGLRLPVDVNGDRIYDQDINILTVVANASYEEYAGGLQTEFTEAGYVGKVDIENAKEEKITVKTTRYIDTEEFKELWSKISKRTKFSLEVLTDSLIKESVEKVNELNINSISVVIEKGEIYFNAKGEFQNVREATAFGSVIQSDMQISNILERISRETGVTKKTVYEILSRSESVDLVFSNPEEYVRSVILIIKNELNNLLVNEGLRYIPTGDTWEITLFEDFIALPSKLVKAERSVFDYVVFDSKGEKEFAEKLEQSSRVKVYTKLPRGFIVNTPLGNYIPDWAIVWETADGNKLYLVRETKFGYENLEQQLTWDEKKKIECASKHFKAIDVSYKVAESEDLLDIL